MVAASSIHRLREAAAPLFSRHGVLAAYAYGSRIAGRPRPDSDLDVGYYLALPHISTALPLDVELRLASALSEAMGVEVDLRSLGPAPLELKGRVLEDGIRIYSGDDVARVGLERDLLARYHDYKDVFRQMHEMRLKRLARRT